MCRWMKVCGSRTWAVESCGRAYCKGLAPSHYFAVSAGRPASAGFLILSPPQRVGHLSNVYICFCDQLTVNFQRVLNSLIFFCHYVFSELTGPKSKTVSMWGEGVLEIFGGLRGPHIRKVLGKITCSAL